MKGQSIQGNIVMANEQFQEDADRLSRNMWDDCKRKHPENPCGCFADRTAALFDLGETHVIDPMWQETIEPLAKDLLNKVGYACVMGELPSSR